MFALRVKVTCVHGVFRLCKGWLGYHSKRVCACVRMCINMTTVSSEGSPIHSICTTSINQGLPLQQEMLPLQRCFPGIPKLKYSYSHDRPGVHSYLYNQIWQIYHRTGSGLEGSSSTCALRSLPASVTFEAFWFRSTANLTFERLISSLGVIENSSFIQDLLLGGGGGGGRENFIWNSNRPPRGDWGHTSPHQRLNLAGFSGLADNPKFVFKPLPIISQL